MYQVSCKNKYEATVHRGLYEITNYSYQYRRIQMTIAVVFLHVN